MPETTIVTVIWENIQQDFELPAKRAYAEWKGVFELSLRKAFPTFSQGNLKISLFCGTHQIMDDESLESLGIYTGAYLKLTLL